MGILGSSGYPWIDLFIVQLQEESLSGDRCKVKGNRIKSKEKVFKIREY